MHDTKYEHSINSNRKVCDGGVWWNHLVSFFWVVAVCLVELCARNTLQILGNSYFFLNTFEYAIREEHQKSETNNRQTNKSNVCICTFYTRAIVTGAVLPTTFCVHTMRPNVLKRFRYWKRRQWFQQSICNCPKRVRTHAQQKRQRQHFQNTTISNR